MGQQEMTSIVPLNAGLAAIHRELGTRGYVYVVCDTLCGTAFVVTQKLTQAVAFLNGVVGEGGEPFSTSSLYEAATIRRGLHRHRWRVLRLDLADAENTLSRLEVERCARPFARSVVLGSPHAYRVVASGEGITA